MSTDDSSSAPDAADSAETHYVRTITSEELMRGEKELHIAHDGRTYRLLLTRNGKLILQK